MSTAALIIAALFAIYSLVRAEFDKYELKREIAQLEEERDELIERILKRAPKIETVDREDLPEGVARQVAHKGRPGRFVSFGAAKRRLESQEPPQRSVNQ